MIDMVVAEGSLDSKFRPLIQIELEHYGQHWAAIDTGFNRQLFATKPEPFSLTQPGVFFPSDERCELGHGSVLCAVTRLRLAAWLGRSNVLTTLMIPRVEGVATKPPAKGVLAATWASDEREVHPVLLVGMELLIGYRLIVDVGSPPGTFGCWQLVDIPG